MKRSEGIFVTVSILYFAFNPVATIAADDFSKQCTQAGGTYNGSACGCTDGTFINPYAQTCSGAQTRQPPASKPPVVAKDSLPFLPAAMISPTEGMVCEFQPQGDLSTKEVFSAAGTGNIPVRLYSVEYKGCAQQICLGYVDCWVDAARKEKAASNQPVACAPVAGNCPSAKDCLKEAYKHSSGDGITVRYPDTKVDRNTTSFKTNDPSSGKDLELQAGWDGGLSSTYVASVPGPGQCNAQLCFGNILVQPKSEGMHSINIDGACLAKKGADETYSCPNAADCLEWDKSPQQKQVYMKSLRSLQPIPDPQFKTGGPPGGPIGSKPAM